MASTTTEERQVGEFQAVSLDGVGVINFVQEDATSLKIEAEPEALPLITTEVKDGTLHIQTQLLTPKVIHLKHPPVYTITSPTLNALDLRGAGRAKIGHLKADQLVITVDGAGDIRLTNQTLGACRIRIAGAGNVQAAGIATVQEIDITGTGNFSGDQFVGETVKVNIAGAGRAKVHATQDLAVDIGGVGSVTYIGDPRITPNVGGLGRVKRA
jgi:putative autotransporter adhesin-like protein